MRNQELIDKRFMQLEGKMKTLNFLLSRPNSSKKEFQDVIKDTETVLEDLKSIIDRNTTPLRNG